jgi:hypothetical protein
MQTAAKDLPNAEVRGTKLWPMVSEQPEYKEKVKALIARLGDKAVEEGSPRNKEYKEGLRAIQDEVYNNLIRKPGMGSSGVTHVYDANKGIMPL